MLLILSSHIVSSKSTMWAFYFSRSWITVAGIRSTGVSSSVGMANLIKDLVRKQLLPSQKQPGVKLYCDYEVNGDTIIMNGEQYKITHGIPMSGLVKAKL